MKMPGLLDDKELQAKYDQFRVNPIAMNPLQMAMYQAGEGIATGQGARLDQVLRGAAVLSKENSRSVVRYTL